MKNRRAAISASSQRAVSWCLTHAATYTAFCTLAEDNADLGMVYGRPAVKHGTIAHSVHMQPGAAEASAAAAAEKEMLPGMTQVPTEGLRIEAEANKASRTCTLGPLLYIQHLLAARSPCCVRY